MTDRPFTAAVCQAAPRRHPDLELLERLGAAIRRCPHGVLVRTGCLVRASRCRGNPAHDSGSYLLVQLCGPDRSPQGPAIPVGPILTRDDVDTVATWLEDGTLTAERLDRRLRAGPHAA